MRQSLEADLIMQLLRDELHEFNPRYKSAPKGWVPLHIPGYGIWKFSPKNMPDQEDLNRWNQMYDEVLELREADKKANPVDDAPSGTVRFANVLDGDACVASIIHIDDADEMVERIHAIIKEYLPDCELAIQPKPTIAAG